MKMKKIVSIVIDGVGDLSCKELNFKSPLQFVHTPFLDALAGILLQIHVFLLVTLFVYRMWRLWFNEYSRTRICMRIRYSSYDDIWL